VKASLKEVQDKLNAQKNLLKGCNREIGEAHAEKSQLLKDLNNTQLDILELERKISKCNKDTNDAAKLVSKQQQSHVAKRRLASTEKQWSKNIS